MAHTLLVFNRLSRRSTPRLLDRLLRLLCEEGSDVDTLVLPHADASDTTLREAAQSRGSRIVIAGGDGTVHWAIQHLAGSEVPVGIVPLGTGNVLARELRLPLNPEHALRALRSSREVRLDLGSLNGRYFAAMAGIGIDADVVRRVGEMGKRWWGRAAFVAAASRSMCRFRPFAAALSWGGSGSTHSAQVENLEGRFWAVLLSNTSVFSGLVNVAPEADPTDGYLDVTAVSDRLSRANLIAQAASLWFLRRPFRRAIKARIQCLDVVLGEPVPVQADGELVGLRAERVSIGVVPRALTVLAPT